MKSLIVVCTYNEPGIRSLLREIYESVLNSDILVVDDSTDPYTQLQLEYFKEEDTENRFSYIHRVREKGLGTAIVRGLTAAKLGNYDVVTVMDGDGQHPPFLINQMLEFSYQYDLVLPSRFLKGGSTKGLDGPFRNIFSVLMKELPKIIFPRKLNKVSDPLGGYFLIKVDKLRCLRGDSWKVLLEILLFADYKNFKEIPYRFREREVGKSKMSIKQGFIYLFSLLKLATRYYFGNSRLKRKFK